MKNLNNNPIDLQQAIQLTKNWRVFYADSRSIPDPNDQQVFRGFTISLDTMRSLVEFADRNPQINSVRVYLAKNTSTVTNDDIHILLTPAHTDALDHAANQDILTIDGESSVMDFTTPCPPTCDINSVLFADNNPLSL